PLAEDVDTSHPNRVTLSMARGDERETAAPNGRAAVPGSVVMRRTSLLADPGGEDVGVERFGGAEPEADVGAIKGHGESLEHRWGRDGVGLLGGRDRNRGVQGR